MIYLKTSVENICHYVYDGKVYEYIGISILTLDYCFGPNTNILHHSDKIKK